jgi:hypothetical protein
MSSLPGAGLGEGNIPIQERCKYLPKISFDRGVLLEMTLQIMDSPDNFATS